MDYHTDMDSFVRCVVLWMLLAILLLVREDCLLREAEFLVLQKHMLLLRQGSLTKATTTSSLLK